MTCRAASFFYRRRRPRVMMMRRGGILAGGNVTHTLTGHREGVWAAQWMRGSEWVLATGGGEGDIRLWDIRRAGAFMVWVPSQTTARPPPLLPAPRSRFFFSITFHL